MDEFYLVFSILSIVVERDTRTCMCVNFRVASVKAVSVTTCLILVSLFRALVVFGSIVARDEQRSGWGV